METDWDKAFFERGYQVGGSNGSDFISNDGRFLVAVKRSTHSARVIREGAMQLALALRKNPKARRAYLIIDLGRLSPERLAAEWKATQQVLAPDLANRISLVVMDQTTPGISGDPEIRRIIQSLSRQATGEQNSDAQQTQLATRGQKHTEVFKVLLLHWMRKDGPLPVRQILEEVGCSYPTFRDAIQSTAIRAYVKRTKARGVELSGFPMKTWWQLVSNSVTSRKPIIYFDASASKMSPETLVRRFGRLKRDDLALGGTFSARHWDSRFNLHGTPRLDISAHVPSGQLDLSFIRKLDPALKRDDSMEKPAAVAVHLIFRAASFYSRDPVTTVNYSDSVETALDLYEIGLERQASELLQRQRPEIRIL